MNKTKKIWSCVSRFGLVLTTLASKSFALIANSLMSTWNEWTYLSKTMTRPTTTIKEELCSQNLQMLRRRFNRLRVRMVKALASWNTKRVKSASSMTFFSPYVNRHVKTVTRSAKCLPRTKKCSYAYINRWRRCWLTCNRRMCGLKTPNRRKNETMLAKKLRTRNRTVRVKKQSQQLKTSVNNWITSPYYMNFWICPT